MVRNDDRDESRLDDAARAGWLYYVAGNTQEEIAQKLGISRQSAQRLVSLAMSKKLIKVRLDHPIASCMSLAEALMKRYGLHHCDVVPSDPSSTSTVLGVAEAAAAYLERLLRSPAPLILALGTGRTIRASVDQLPAMDCPQHKIVSLVGNITPDGAASFFDVVTRISDIVKAPHFPMPVPVVASSVEEKAVLLKLKAVKHVCDLARRADVTMVGIGSLDDNAPLFEDGFITRAELRALHRAGAVGEIVGWAFDRQGRILSGLTNERVASVPIGKAGSAKVIGAAMGRAKLSAMRAALEGGLISGLITDEATATALTD
ncbi:MAG TPA: sugar-binding transcriptional regulator [Stellaceae bacterium]|nr:sugar-binding transcriptional regulator [Stellaceae bacterium]